MRTSVFAFCAVSLLQQGVFGQGDCSDANITATCAAENRLCIADSEEEACGPCIEGFIEFPVKQPDSEEREPTCINIDTDLTLQDFLDYFQPLFRENANEDRAALNATRLAALREAARFIQQHNAKARSGASPYTLGLNKFAADTDEDTTHRLGLLPMPSDSDIKDTLRSQGVLADDVEKWIETLPAPPRYVNWVEDRAVTSVKDQGACGCCWAVAAAGAIEGVVAVQSNFTYLQSVSFQQLISCADQEWNGIQNLGCNGGFPFMAIAYSNLNVNLNGTATLNEYPFSDGDGDTTETCTLVDQEPAFETEGIRVMMGSSNLWTFEERVKKMKEVVSQHPVSIVMVAGCKTLSRYKGGVLDEGCECNPPNCGINHAVLMVGYNDDYDPPYWIIKNSWGKDWGEDGYFRVSQANSNGGDPRSWGYFGILNTAVFPVTGKNLTEEVYDKPQEVDDGLEWWHILLIVLGSCALGIGCAMVFRSMRGEAPY